MSEMIYRFGDLPGDLFNLAGGKGASLCRMFQAKYPVPDGFVILASAFEDGQLAQDARQALAASLTALRQADPAARFAIRSSALNEDSPQNSYAGEFETVLNVKTDDEVLAAVSKVTASAHSERVQAYSRRLGLGSDHAMAVVVQRMLQPDFAGVLFTADPISGSHAHMTGNFVHGLGEQLVSGEADAQHFQVMRPGGKYRGPKEFRQFAGKLFHLAARLEKDAGGALDIEWAACDNQVYLLQSRPVTTLQTIDYDTYAVNETLDHDFVWTNNNIGEALPDVMTPFTWSIIRALDMETQKMSGYYLWSGNICGRGYSNVSLILSLTSKFGLSMGYSKKLVGNAFGNFPANLEIPVYPLGMIEMLQDLRVRGTQSYKRIQFAQKHKDEYLRQTRPWCEENIRRIEAAGDAQQLLDLWTNVIRPFVSKIWAIFLGGASDLTLVTLQNRLEKLVGVEDANCLLSNFRGNNGLESLGPLLGIAKVIKGELSRQEYLASYGHRCSHEFEMSLPYPVEDPDYLDKQIAEYQKSGVDVETLLAKQHEHFTRTKERFIQRYPAKGKWLENSLAQIGRAARTRESLRGEFTRTFRVMRAFMLKTGELTGIGKDVFFLYDFEIPQALKGDRAMLIQLPARKHNYERYCSLPTLPMFIKGRFDPFEWVKDPARRADYYDPDAKAALVNADLATIKGFAGAAGIVQGPVRVLSSLEEAATFLPGEVLVTSTTNIGWTPLFPRTCAIVTDIGAPLSHAAIVARELGIPAVVGCGTATTRLHTGDQVRVDGGRGIVQKI
jgi:rifampicin phosphotransferase